jgi:hypothetical protein
MCSRDERANNLQTLVGVEIIIATKRPADAFRPHTRPPGGCGVT